MPKYPGGEMEMFKLFGENIIYPADAKENNIQGKVFASFVVEEDGTMTDILIIRGLSESCDKEVLRVLKMFPNWTPATKDGNPVRVQYKIPVKFTLTTFACG